MACTLPNPAEKAPEQTRLTAPIRPSNQAQASNRKIKGERSKGKNSQLNFEIFKTDVWEVHCAL